VVEKTATNKQKKKKKKKTVNNKMQITSKERPYGFV
jgi:hypothetical protein